MKIIVNKEESSITFLEGDLEYKIYNVDYTELKTYLDEDSADNKFKYVINIDFKVEEVEFV